MDYLEKLPDFLREYYDLLCEGGIPEFLYDYINTSEMQKQNRISVSCGTYYTKLNDLVWYSSLDHSIAVALIVWNFTHDKKQTIAALLHDIATPAFKHCVDFINGDYETQESTEDLTKVIIENSNELMGLLDKDGIKVEEVCDYHIYPIADNDTPQLAADRLEYTLTNGCGVRANLWNLETIKKVYKDIEVLTNEKGIIELGFKTKEIAELFVNVMSELSILYRCPSVAYSMQLIADTLIELNKEHLISKEDLYKKSEEDVFKCLEQSNNIMNKERFNTWKNASIVIENDIKPEVDYFVSIEKNKIRYINPLVEVDGGVKRIADISSKAKEDIDRAFNYRTKKYLYIDK